MTTLSLLLHHPRRLGLIAAAVMAATTALPAVSAYAKPKAPTPIEIDCGFLNEHGEWQLVPPGGLLYIWTNDGDYVFRCDGATGQFVHASTSPVTGEAPPAGVPVLPAGSALPMD